MYVDEAQDGRLAGVYDKRYIFSYVRHNADQCLSHELAKRDEGAKTRTFVPLILAR